MRRFFLAGFIFSIVLLGACSTGSDDRWLLKDVPPAENFCLEAQRVVTRTTVPMQLVIHADFDAFVKSKAVIQGPEIQQYNWYNDAGAALGFSCKLKSADHLNMTYGEGTAGPDQACQLMNQKVFELVAKQVRDPVFIKVTFDPNETVENQENPGMTGPDWLAPYMMDYRMDDVLHIASKGFIVNFTDAAYAKAPPRFRGVHYCHLIAPTHLEALLAGTVEPGNQIGQNPPARFMGGDPREEQGQQ